MRCNDLLRREPFDARSFHELFQRTELMAQKRTGRRHQTAAIGIQRMLRREVKTARELFDEFVTHHDITISSTGILHRSNVHADSHERLLWHAISAEPEQREQLFHSHAELVSGDGLMRFQAPHISLGRIEEAMNQRQQFPA